eukprot:scaffold616299_cov138-Attheya_sp.AAC.1
MLGDVEGPMLGKYEGIELGSVLGDVEGSVLGKTDGTKLGFVLGDVEGPVLGNDDGFELGSVLGDVEGSVLEGFSLGEDDGNTLGFVLGDLEGPVLGKDDGIELGSVLSVLEGSVLGKYDGTKLGFVLGDLEGSVLGGDDPGTTLGSLLRLRCKSSTVGGLRRRGDIIVELGTEVSGSGGGGLGFVLGTTFGSLLRFRCLRSTVGGLRRRRGTTVELPVGTEVGDTGGRLGCLVGFLLGGNVALCWVGTDVFADLELFISEVNAIEFSPPMAFCIVSTPAETNKFSWLSVRGRLPRGMEGNLEECSCWAAALAMSSIARVALLPSVSFLNTCVSSIAEEKMFL